MKRIFTLYVLLVGKKYSISSVILSKKGSTHLRLLAQASCFFGLLFCCLVSSNTVFSQSAQTCTNTYTVQAPTTAQITGSFTSYAGDYFVLTTTAGHYYTLTSSLSTQAFNVRTGSASGTLIATGAAGFVNFIAPAATVYVNMSLSACTTSATARTITYTDVTPSTTSALPLSQGFNTASIPANWFQTSVGISNSSYYNPYLTFVTSSVNPSTTPFEGANFVNFNSYNAGSSATDRLVAAPITTTGTSSVTVSYNWYQENGSTSNDNIQVQYSTDGFTWSNIGSAIPRYNATNGWTAQSVVSTAIGNLSKVYIGFLFTSAYGDNCSFDNVLIQATPSCIAPIIGTPTFITATSASIPFTCTSCSPGNAYIIEYGASGFTPGTGAIAGIGGTVVTGTASPIALSGLSASTTYDVYVRQNCTASSNGYSANSSKATFTTSCGTYSIPYTQNFDGVTAPAIPNCLTVSDANSDGTTWVTSSASAATGFSSPNVLRYSYNSSNTANDWASTPGLVLTGGTTYLLSYKYAASYSSASYSEKLEIKYATGSSATSLAAGTSLLSSTTYTDGMASFITNTISFTPASSGTYYIGFHAISAANQGYLDIDDISIVNAPTCPTFSSTISIGGTVTTPGSLYPTLTAAIAALSYCGITQPTVLALNSSYPTSSVTTNPETFPIALPAITSMSSTNTITILPASGTTQTITSANTTATISISGGKYWIIDGRAGGTGTSALTIANTSTATGGAAIQFINDAQYNKVQYTTLTSVYASATSGIINFSTATSVGNNNNTITNNTLNGGAGSILSPTVSAAVGIYSIGSSSFSNTGNTISNNSIADVFNAAVATSGIYLSTYNSGWTITGNNIYQTAARTATTGLTITGIFISSSSGGSYTISGNVIGYGSASASGTTSYTSTSAINFVGMDLALSTTASSIQGNTVSGLSLVTASAANTLSGIFTGIYLRSGSANIGTTTGNIIGAASGTGAISINATASGDLINGIYAASSGIVTIQNNTISSITTSSAAAATIGFGFNGIYTSGSSGTFTISSNIIGGSTANAVQIGTTGTTSGTVLFYGMDLLNTGTQTVSGNTLNNITASSTSANTYLFGIYSSGSASGSSITSNTVSNLTTTSAATSGTLSVIGIDAVPGTASMSISQNIISALANTNGTAASSLAGLLLAGTSTGGTVSRNMIYGVTSPSTATPTLVGIYTSTGGWTISNNMVSVTNGSNATAATLYGIWTAATSSYTQAFDYNSIYIGGTGAGSALSYGFLRSSSATVSVLDNIFANVRTGSTGGQYAIANTYTTPATGWSSNYNVLNSPGIATVGLWNGTNETFAAWQTVSAGDASSYSGITVTFLNPTTGDLHMNMGTTPTPIESGGVAVPGITIDYDGQTRPGGGGTTLGGGSAPDIGADEFDGAPAVSACSGTPIAGTIAVGTTPVCPGASSVLTLSGYTTGVTGITFQWQSSTDNSTFTNISGATTTTYTATPSVTTYYRVVVTCSVSTLSANTASATVAISTPAYATYNGTSYTQSFESWVNFCSTTDAPSVNWRTIPATSDSSWRRDDQGSSASWSSTSGSYTPVFTDGAHSARFHSYDALSGNSGKLDLFINMSAGTPNTNLTFDYINTGGTDSLSVYQSTDGGTTFTKLGSSLTTASSWTSQSFTVTSTSATTVIRLKATSDFGASDIGVDNFKMVPLITYTWTGGANTTDWNTSANWSGNTVPSATSAVTIATATFQPVIGSSTSALCGSIVLNSGTTLGINGTLNDAGNWTNNGSAVSGAGTVTMSGSGITIGGSATTTFPNLNISSTGNISLAINTTVTGNLAQGGVFAVGSSTTSYILTVGGNFTQTAGTTYISYAANNSAMNVTGTFGISAGLFILENSTTSTGATVTVAGAGGTTISGTGEIIMDNAGSAATASFQTTGFTSSGTGNTSNTLDFGLGSTVNHCQFKISGNFSHSSTGVFYTSATTQVGSFIFNGTGTQTFNYAGTNSAYTSYTINSGATLQLLTNLTMAFSGSPSSIFTVNGTIDFQTFSIGGASSSETFILNSGATIKTANTSGVYAASATANTGSLLSTLTARTFNAAANYIFNGIAAQTTNFNSTTAATMANLTINNSAGVTNNAANIVSGLLTFTAGKLTTTSTLTLTNTATTAVTGGSASSYINGPLNWTLGNSTAYLFPVGTTSAYYPYSITTTTGNASPIVQVSATAGSTGGTANGTTLSAISATEYWKTTTVSGTFTGGSLSLGRNAALGSLNAIGSSANLIGAYASLGGTVGTLSGYNSVNNSSQTGAIASGASLYNVLAQTASYTVTYNGNGNTSGTVPVDASSPYAYNATVTVLGNTGSLVKTGYIFTGWNTAANGTGTAYAPGATFAITANTTLYAQYTINTYTLTYTAGANGTISGTTPQTVNYNTSGTAVTAVPNTGYHFVSWSDGSTANPRTDNNVTANISVTASFAINTYTLTYTAGANGTISGTTPQTVNYGASGTAVTAVPGTGYHFVSWSDGSTTNPRTDANVMANISVTASFAINTYTLTYTAGANGTISGTTPQTVNYGASGTAVTAVPGTGYHFVSWSDGSTTNPRTDANVMANISVTASFAINTYTLTYTAGANGTISGTTPQTVNYGASGTAVTAVPGTGYHFVSWSDGSTTNPRTDANVMANISVTASFAINTYTLTYTAGANGTISGTTPQTVNYGSNGTAVTAVPNTGYYFVQWSDGSTVNPRTDNNVTADISVTATFAINTYTITATAGANGSITPNATTTVNYGGTQAYTITPSTGYHILDVQVDGISDAGAIGSGTYTFSNVTANHTISATFAINTYTITSSAGGNGTINPNGSTTVNYGGSQTYTITPNANYGVQDVLVDGVSVGAVTTYAFNNVTANHTISVTFYLATCPNPPTANAGTNGSVCSNASYTLGGSIGGGATSATWSSSGTGTFNGGTTFGSATSYTPSAADAAAGSVIITLTTNNPNPGVCDSAVSSFTLTVNPITTITAQPAATTTYCQNASPVTALSVTATGTGTLTYQWYSNATNSNTGGTIISGATASTYTPPVTAAGTTYYYVTVTSPGCGAATSNTAAIVVNAATNITSQPAGATYCQNAPGTPLSVTATGGNLTYQWYSNTVNSNFGGALISGAASATYIPSTTTSGTVYYYVIISGICGNITSNTAAIVVTATAAITSQPTGATYCQNATAAALSVTASGSGTLSYQWYSNTTNSYSGGTPISGENSSTYTPSTATVNTTYYYVVVNSSSCGTATSGIAAIMVNATPVPTFTASPAGTICTGSSVTYTTQSGQTSYVWTFSGTAGTDYSITSGGTSTSNTVTLTWITTASKTVTVNYTTGTCTGATPASATNTVAATPVPTFTASPAGTICTGSSVTYTTQSGQSNYVWTFTGTAGTDYSITSGGTSTSSTVTLTWITTGSKTVTVNYTSGTCTGATPASATNTVAVAPVPTFTASPAGTICTGSSVTYTTQSGQSSYAWTFSGTAGTDYSITSGGTSTSNTVTLVWLTTGSKTVTVNYTSGTCTGATPASATNTVAASPVPTFTASPAGTICTGSNVTYTTQGGQSNYVWTFTGTAGTDYSITSGGTSTSNTVTLTWLTTGSKTVTVNYTSGTCTGATPASTTNTVVAPPVPTFTATPTNPVCTNTNATYTTQSGQSSYVWTYSGTAGTDYNIISGGTSTSNTVTLVWLTGGNKTVTVNYSNGTCSGTTPASSAITVNGAPTGPLASNTYTIGSCAFPTIASAASYVNTNGIAGAVIFNVPAGYTETVTTASGIVLGSATLNATLNATNTLKFVKSGTGANPILTAATGVALPSGTAPVTPDGIFSIRGADYITIDGLTFTDNNTSSATTAMEFGIGMFKLSATDGANNNTIQNCTFNMQRVNNAAGTLPLGDGAVAIGVYNSIATDATTTLTPTATSGANSNNKIYANTINSGNTGIDIYGYNNPTAPYNYTDQNNDIGGSSTSTGNAILNYGGGATTNPAVGIRANGQYGLNLSYNIINNNNGSGINHSTTLRGIWLQAALGASETVSNNTITVSSGATTTQLTGIENAAGGTANSNTVNINNNSITTNYTTATSGFSYGIFNSIAPATLNINTNIITLNTSATSASIGNFAIYQTGAVASALNINTNIISENYTAASTSAIASGIYNTGAANTSTVSISNNTFNGFTFSGTTGGTGTLYGIYQTGTPLSETVSGNNFNNLTIKSTGALYLLYNSYSAPTGGSKTIQNNIITTGLTRTASGTVYGYYDFGSSPSGVLHTYSGNNFSNINTGGSSFYGFYSLDYSSSNPGIAAYNNTINNITANGSTIYGMYLSGFAGTSATPDQVYGNTISNISSTSATTIYGLYLGSTALYVNAYSNTVSNISSAGSSASMYGLGITGGTAINAYSNNISGLTVSTSGSIYGTYISGGTTVNAYSNSINGLTLSGSGNLYSAYFGGGTTVNYFKNKIYNNAGSNASSLVYGTYVSTSPTTLNFYNNLIGDLRNTAANSTSTAIAGFYSAATTSGATENVSYNTIYLNATSSGTNFSTAGIYHTYSTTATSAQLVLRNNVIVNNSTPNGSGLAVAFRRSAATNLNNYSTSSNNNDFYAGTPGATHLIYYDGTNSDQTLSAFKTRVSPAETNSVTENPTFLSTSGSNANFLNINTATPTQLESGAVNISGITDDYSGTIRYGNTGYVACTPAGTAPDIGAWEFCGTPAAVVTINSIAITPAGNLCTATARTVTATVTAGSSSITSVVLYYSLNGGTATAVTMTLATGSASSGTSTWIGTIPASGNAVVTWYITATDAITSKTTNGTSYQDAPLTGVTATATASSNPVCVGSSSVLTATFSSSGSAPTGYTTPSVTNATTDEDLGNITITQGTTTIVNNTSAINTLTGTIGTATGTAGGYSNFTAFGPYSLKPGVTYNFSIKSLDQGSSFPHYMYIFIDYNRDGLFTGAGETVYASATSTSGAHTETGTFTVPITVVAGKTRMRIAVSEGALTSSSTSTGYGEFEDYLMDVAPTFSSYSWKDETNATVGTTNPLTITPTVTHTYTVTATDANGCTITSTPGLTVTVNPIPTAPTATNSIQCGTQVPTASVASPSSNTFSGPVFNWYAAATGGTALQSSTSTTYTTAVSATTTFYVSVTNPSTGCESSRTPVTVTVTSPDAVTASATSAGICLGKSDTLNVTKAGTTNTYVYTWTCTSSNASTSGISGSVTGSQVIVTPTATGTYTYQVTANDATTNCTTTSSVSITVNALPTTPTITASATRVCSGSSVILSANSTSATYCTPSYTNPGATGDYIGNVTFAGINNTTGDASSDYTYYNALNANVNGGSSYTISLTAGGTSSLYAQQFGVWIDYNQNGIFEASEFVYASSAPTNSPTASTGTIVIPTSAYNGITRMRIISQYSTAITSGQACSNSLTYGEAEDYNVTITGATTNPSAGSYLWSTGATTQSITVNPTTTTSYTVTLTNAGGCSATSAPTTVTVVPPLAGVYSVGSGTIAGEAGHYSTITAAVADYNSLCLGGAVTFALTDATYSSAETFPITINANSNANSTNTLTIKPNTGVTSSITGSSSTAIIKLNGANYITIDGSNSGSNSQNLTLSNTSTGSSTEIVWIASVSSTSAATNNTIKNCIITGTGATGTLSGINAGGGNVLSTVPADAPNSNNTIQNNIITKTQNGLYLNGYATSPYDQNWVIQNNTFGSGTSASKLGYRGMFLSNASNFTITNNNIIGVESSGTAFGIQLNGGLNGGNVNNNKITDVKNTYTSTGYQAYGLYLGATTTASNIKIYNNFISDVTAYGANSVETNNGSGIFVYSGGGYNIYYNSISLSTNQTSSSSRTACIVISSNYPTTAGSINIVDNILSNTETTGTDFSIFVNNASNAEFGTINYNDYYSSGNIGYLSNARATLAAWRTATSQDVNSVSLNPQFISATDLHINAANGALDNLGTPVSGITTDIDGDTRSTTTPDIGADEFSATACSGTSGGIALYTGSNICTSGSTTVTASGYPTGTSVTYQWEYSIDNFVSDIHDLTGQTTAATATTGTISTTTYYRLRSTCTPTSTIWYSVSDTVFVVTPLVTGTTPATICGSGTATLQATGTAGTTLYWYDAATGGNLVGTGSPFTTPAINSTTTYYVSASTGTVTTVGPASPAAEGGTVGTQTITWDVNFTTLSAATLKSVDIFPITSGQSGVLKILSGTGTGGTVLATINYTTSVSGGSTPQTIPINYLISTPGTYSLYTSTLPGSGISRNTSGASYPYTSSVANITGNGFDQTYYMGLYNWNFTAGCESNRTAVIATVNPAPAIAIAPTSATICLGSSTVLTASSTTDPSYTYTWTPGTLTGASQTVSPTATTIYTVTATDNTSGTYAGCTNTESATVTVNPVPLAVTVTPNNAAQCYGSIQQLTATGGNTTGIGTALAENFATNAPTWTRANYSTGGQYPDSAAWKQHPDKYAYSGTTFRSNDHSEFFMSNSDQQGYDDNDDELTYTTLTSPAFSTVGYSSLSLNFYQYYAYYNDGYYADTAAAVEVSTNGSTWSTIKNYTSDGVTVGAPKNFSLATLNLNSYVGNSTLYIRFRYKSYYGFYWAIDNVLITGNQNVTGQFAWSPVTNLYTNTAATTPYVAGSYASTVYAKVLGSQIYKATSTNTSGCSKYDSSIVTLSSTPTWTGITSSQWDDATNWCNGLVPVSTTDVIIPTGVPNLPVLDGDFAVHDIVIASGMTLSLNDHTLTLNGAFSGAGKFTGSVNSGLVIGGAAGTVSFTNNTSPATRYNYLKTLTLTSSSSSVTLGDTLNIAPGTFASPGTVTVTGGNLHAGNKLILKSSSAGDAKVAYSTGTISDSVVVERFIPARRAWRFITAPVNTSQTINKAWQEGVTNPDIYTHYNPNPGFGTEITYDNLTAHGYDVNTTLNPSIKYWNSLTNSWLTPATTNGTNLNAYSAWCLFVRGSRAVDLSLARSAPVDTTVLRAKGVLNETNGAPVVTNYPGVTANSYLFVGNPYASPINILSSLGNTSGINQTKFYVWDPEVTGNYGVGAYVSYSGGVFAPAGSTYSGSNYAQSGQGFFVQATSSGTVTTNFQQGDKTGGTESSVNRVMTAPPAAFYTNLMTPSGDSLVLVDGVAAAFGNGYSASVDAMDANKRWNFEENIALVRDTSWLAIEFRPVPVLTDTLFYKLYLYQNQPYALKIFAQNIPAGFPQAWLVDRYLNTKTAFNTGDTLLYNFTPNTDTSSYRSRFILVFKRTLNATPVAGTFESAGAESKSMEGNVSIYPNPVVSGSKILLKFSNMKKDIYEVTVNSIDGKALSKQTIDHQGGSYNYELQLDARWTTGNYIIKTTGSSGYVGSVKLVVGK